MNRRGYIQTLSLTTVAGLSGCLSLASPGSSSTISIVDVDDSPAEGLNIGVEAVNDDMRGDKPPSIELELEYSRDEPYEYDGSANPFSSQVSDEATPGLVIHDHTRFYGVGEWSRLRELHEMPSDCWMLEDSTMSTFGRTYTWEPGDTMTERYSAFGIQTILEEDCPNGEFRFSQMYPADYRTTYRPRTPIGGHGSDFEWGFTIECAP